MKTSSSHADEQGRQNGLFRQTPACHMDEIITQTCFGQVKSCAKKLVQILFPGKQGWFDMSRAMYSVVGGGFNRANIFGPNAEQWENSA